MSRKRKPQEETKGRLRAFRLEPALDQKLEEYADELGVSCSWLIRMYVEEGLEHKSSNKGEKHGAVREVRVLRSRHEEHEGR